MLHFHNILVSFIMVLEQQLICKR